MHQSGKLRSQSPDPAEGSELRVPSYSGICDPSFESLLRELVQQYHNAYGTEKSVSPHPSAEPPLAMPSSSLPDAAPESPRGELERSSESQDILPSPQFSDPEFESLLNEIVQQSQDTFRAQMSVGPQSSLESSLPLPTPSILSTEATPEKPRGESERGDEGRDIFMTLLTILLVGLALICGMLLGIHYAVNRGYYRTLKPTGSQPAASAALSSQSAVDHISLGNTAPVGTSRQGRPQEKHEKARVHFERPGGLTVYQNDRVIFELPPGQVGTAQEPTSVDAVPKPQQP